jgi:hypothetical protein
MASCALAACHEVGGFFQFSVMIAREVSRKNMTLTTTVQHTTLGASCPQAARELKPQLELTLVLPPPPKPSPPPRSRRHTSSDAKRPVAAMEQMLTMREVLNYHSPAPRHDLQVDGGRTIPGAT